MFIKHVTWLRHVNVKNKTSEIETKYVHIDIVEIMLCSGHIWGWKKKGQALIKTVETAHLDVTKCPWKNINNWN
jgi:hypothetical protein